MPSSSNRSENWPPPNANRLAALREKRPQRKAAQIRAFWPDIKIAIENGHSYGLICECLELMGVPVTVKSLSSYVSRMRKKDAILRVPDTPRGPVKSLLSVVHDPLANVRESEENRTTFDYRPEAIDPKKLI
jgi:hypothetical protein